jgi:O-acetyl-ADP-ribose deacetylase (regulator of RNase III)
VGPIWKGGTQGEPELLERAYETSFERALDAGDVRSIAFPAISAGVYGYPKESAIEIAVRVMRRHEPKFKSIIACAYDERTGMLYRRELSVRPK